MLRRRDVSLVGLGLMAASADAQSRRTGRLVVIGGAEDRLYDKVILRRFTELCGGPGSRIRVLSAASGVMPIKSFIVSYGTLPYSAGAIVIAEVL